MPKKIKRTRRELDEPTLAADIRTALSEGKKVSLMTRSLGTGETCHFTFGMEGEYVTIMRKKPPLSFMLSGQPRAYDEIMPFIMEKVVEDGSPRTPRDLPLHYVEIREYYDA